MKRFELDVIRKHAALNQMSLGNVEKDYVLSVALLALSEYREGLVFKGGTCLKKAYFPNYRFSSDLDFSGQRFGREWLRERFTTLFQQREMEGVRFLAVQDRSKTGSANLNLKVQYASHLAPPERPHVDSVVVDVNFEARVLLEPEIITLRVPEAYSLPEIECRVLQLKEILAEKIHAIYRRPKPRDLYDLNYLLEQRVEFDVDLVNRKLQVLDRVFDPVTFGDRVARLGPDWSRDMRGLLARPPAFAVVADAVLARIGVRP